MMQPILAVLRIHIMGSMMVLKLKPLIFVAGPGATGGGGWDHFWFAARKTCPTSLKCQARPGERPTSWDHARISGIEGGQVGVVARFFWNKATKIILVNYTYFGDIYS